jgi:hypothetical protein
MATIDPRLVSIAITELPAIIDWIRNAFMQANPGAPVPTDAEVHAAYVVARDASLAKDEQLLIDHPGTL